MLISTSTAGSRIGQTLNRRQEKQWVKIREDTSTSRTSASVSTTFKTRTSAPRVKRFIRTRMHSHLKMTFHPKPGSAPFRDPRHPAPFCSTLAPPGSPLLLFHTRRSPSLALAFAPAAVQSGASERLRGNDRSILRYRASREDWAWTRRTLNRLQSVWLTAQFVASSELIQRRRRHEFEPTTQIVTLRAVRGCGALTRRSS